MTGLTEDLANFVSSVKFADLPTAAHAIVGRGFADCVAVTLLGRGEPAVTGLRPMTEGVPGPAHILFTSETTSVEMAALVNGTAAQALDFDDTGLDGHPSALLVPTLLAVAEQTGADGQAMVAAYVAGYEVWAELARREMDKYHARGFHPTGLLGTLAAAAAASVLYRLDPLQTRHALGIAASFASGLVANFGSMTKPLQTGRAAEGGVRAARLAANGYTAAADPIEHSLGFLSAFSPHGRIDLASPTRLGERWAIVETGLNLKLYPICYAAHRIVDAALDLRRTAALTPDKVSQIEQLIVLIGRAQSAPLRSHHPTTAVDARFSGEFAVAAALIAGQVTMEEVADGFVGKSEVQTLMRKVSFELTDERDPEDSLFSPADQVTAIMADGRTIKSVPVRRARGHASNPAPDEVLRQKFLSCVAAVLDTASAQLLFETTMKPHALGSVREINAICAGAGMASVASRT